MGSRLSLSRWRLLYFLFPPGFSRLPGEADGDFLDDGRGEGQGSEEDQEEQDGEEAEEVKGDTWEERYSQLESGGLEPTLECSGEEERERRRSMAG